MDLSKIDFVALGFQTLAMMLTALLIPRLKITSLLGALFMVIALSYINTKVWDAALFYKIPDHFSYQAGLLLVSNGFIFWLLVKILPGIEIDGFLPALIAPIVFTLCSIAVTKYLPLLDWQHIFDSVSGAVSGVKNEVSSAAGGR